jgi:hypothetical protein
MTFTENHKAEYKALTSREWQLSEKIDELFIADAERVCAEQSNRRYRLLRCDVVRLIQEYSDIPISRILTVLNFELELWSSVSEVP